MLNKKLSPAVTTIILVIVAVIVGMFYWKGNNPAAKAEEIDRLIEATCIKPPADWKPGDTITPIAPTPGPSKATGTAPKP